MLETVLPWHLTHSSIIAYFLLHSRQMQFKAEISIFYVHYVHLTQNAKFHWQFIRLNLTIKYKEFNICYVVSMVDDHIVNLGKLWIIISVI